jgi:DNA-binding CsgD family transcriptional regulator
VEHVAEHAGQHQNVLVGKDLLARRFWLSEGTIRNRISEILGKLGVRTRLEAVQLARDNGWL